ncbi:hypothetical protein [Amycolatopsis sp. NPDC021455]|uniref:hypothetical protein n=1 Tax=Amycolatopsis sp. NPDC021455 TaxID=3154901 RepID=UPI0033DD87A0
MSEGTEIPLDRLREVAELLLAHVERSGGSVTLERDLFWELTPEQLVAMADDPDRVVGYGLVWLADVLRALGHQALG